MRWPVMVSMFDSGANGLVQAPAGDIVLCSWARHFTLTVPLSTQVYKWVPANDGLASHPRRSGTNPRLFMLQKPE